MDRVTDYNGRNQPYGVHCVITRTHSNRGWRPTFRMVPGPSNITCSWTGGTRHRRRNIHFSRTQRHLTRLWQVRRPWRQIHYQHTNPIKRWQPHRGRESKSSNTTWSRVWHQSWWTKRWRRPPLWWQTSFTDEPTHQDETELELNSSQGALARQGM